MLIRQNGPVFGSSNPYAQPGETQINLATRNLRSTDHYEGTTYNVQRQIQDTYVVNLQHAVDLSVTHVFTPRFSASLGVPFVDASWSIPSPQSGGEATRAAGTEVGEGLGDISVVGQWWGLRPDRFLTGNFAVGLGVKMPTGNAGDMSTYVNSAGTDPKPRYVDQSVQPGDGGWGLLMQLSGFKDIPHAQLFGTLNYLANPKDENSTTSGSINRSTLANPPIVGATAYNSVPDQYLARLGAAVPVFKTGFVGTLAWHVEGVPRYDLIGRSDGFRRPGVEMFIEPGLSYAKGPNVFNFELPIAYYRDREPNPYTNALGDATFPNYIFLASYGFRFGGNSKANTGILANEIASPDLSPTAGATSSAMPSPSSITFKPFKLKTVDGEAKSLPDVLGKATLVVFFYPTCPYCNLAAPHIQQLYDAYKDKGLSVVYVNLLPEEQKLIKGWQTDHGYTAPVLVGASTASLQKDYNVSATPTHYLLDSTGKVLAGHKGYQEGDERELENEIKLALGLEIAQSLSGVDKCFSTFSRVAQ